MVQMAAQRFAGVFPLGLGGSMDADLSLAPGILNAKIQNAVRIGIIVMVSNMVSNDFSMAWACWVAPRDKFVGRP